MLDLDPAASCARAGCSPAGCSWSTPSTAGSSATTRSRPTLAAEHPYDEWLHAGADPPRPTCPSASTSCTPRPRSPVASRPSATPRRSCGSCSRRWPAPAPRRSARWAPTRPIAVLSDRPRLLFDYFTQLFAQVTNPPLDAIREELVTSLGTIIGPEGNVLDGDRRRTAASCVLPFPVIDNDELAKIVHINADGDLPGFATAVVRGLYDVTGGGDGAAGAAGADLRRGLRGDRGRRPVRRAVRPRLRPRPRADPVAAAHLGRAPPPDPGEDPHPGRPARRGRRRPRGAPRRAAHRLRRGGGQPLPGDGVGRGPRPLGPARPGVTPEKAVAQPDQGARQGRPQGDVQDGHLDRRLLPRRAGVRGDRPRAGAGRRVLHRHRHPSSAASASTSSPPRSPRRHATAYPPDGVRPAAPQARGRRRVPVAPRGRAAPVRPGDGVPAAARDPRSAATTSSSSTPRGSTSRPSG